MKKKKERRIITRSLKQQWQAERYWRVLGHITGVEKVLQEYFYTPSLTIYEQGLLAYCAGNLQEIIKSIRDKNNAKKSFKLYKLKRGKL